MKSSEVLILAGVAGGVFLLTKFFGSESSDGGSGIPSIVFGDDSGKDINILLDKSYQERLSEPEINRNLKSSPIYQTAAQEVVLGGQTFQKATSSDLYNLGVQATPSNVKDFVSQLFQKQEREEFKQKINIMPTASEKLGLKEFSGVGQVEAWVNSTSSIKSQKSSTITGLSISTGNEGVIKNNIPSSTQQGGSSIKTPKTSVTPFVGEGLSKSSQEFLTKLNIPLVSTASGVIVESPKSSSLKSSSKPWYQFW